MSLYIEFMKKSFLKQFTYRVNSYFNMAGTVLRLLITFSVWTSLYANHTEIKGITLNDMIGYIIINAMILSLIGNGIANNIAEKVRSGSIAVDIVKPIRFKWYIISEEIGNCLYKSLFSSVPVLVIGIVLWDFQFPSLNFMIIFIISMILGLFINYYINYIVGLLTFWFKTSFHIDWVMKAFFELFSGILIPLWFYPNFLFNIAKLLPFRYISFEPILIFLGKLTLMDSLKIILYQIIWIIVLSIVERLIWIRAQKMITVFGG